MLSPAPVSVSRLAARTLDLLLPPRCLACGRLVEAAHSLCAECWRGVSFLAAPLCARCGHPFEIEAGDGALCAQCSREPPAWNRARAVFRYDEKSRRLVLAFKYGDRTDAARAFGQWMARAGAEMLDGADLLVPVPLHWTRLFARRYNQAALLARAVSRHSGVVMAPDALIRLRRTRPQGRMDWVLRRRNVRGAFAVPARARAKVAGKCIVLVDDVLTTGATAGACSEALLEAGAASVDVLALARTAGPQL